MQHPAGAEAPDPAAEPLLAAGPAAEDHAREAIDAAAQTGDLSRECAAFQLLTSAPLEQQGPSDAGREQDPVQHPTASDADMAEADVEDGECVEKADVAGGPDGAHVGKEAGTAAQLAAGTSDVRNAGMDQSAERQEGGVHAGALLRFLTVGRM